MRRILTLFLLLGFAVMGLAQDVTHPDIGGFETQGSIAAGYRFTDVGGRQQKFAELFSLRDGFRLHDASFFGKASDDQRFADNFSFFASGLGGEPFQGGQLRLSKSRLKETSCCLSCHLMNDHGKSLYRDDSAFLPAAHFQNHRVPAESACFTCHTDYTMYGDFTAKWRGLHHIYVQYFGTIPKPSEIKLYAPYNNRECLHCHEGARSFEEGVVHTADADTLTAIKSNKLSCISSGCHDRIHDVGTLNGKVWSPSQ